MTDKRTFIALDISDSARTACESHIDRLRREFGDVRVGWERPEKLHITLKFLGATNVAILPELENQLSKAAEAHPPFKLRMSKPGVFPSRSRPRILWLGVEDETHSTASLHMLINIACEPLGFEGERREFRPHVTIGRIREPNRAGALTDAHLRSPIEPVEFEVRKIVVYESNLQPSGSVYSPLFKASLV